MGDVPKIEACLSILRRLPPGRVNENLEGLLTLCPDEADELLQRVDQPLVEQTCAESGRQFLLCDYNRDGDSYRSPWSNAYSPALDDGFLPSDRVRALEVEANTVYDMYRELYFEAGSVSSVYMWDLDGGFAGCFLIKKTVRAKRERQRRARPPPRDGSGRRDAPAPSPPPPPPPPPLSSSQVKDAGVTSGSWDSVAVIEVCEDAPSKGMASYKLTTTIMISMDVEKDAVGTASLAGNLTRQHSKEAPVSAERTHVMNMGELIEDMENEMRANLDALCVQKTRARVERPSGTKLRPPLSLRYIQKTREVVNSIRRIHGAPTQSNAFTMGLNAAVMKHGATRKVDSET